MKPHYEICVFTSDRDLGSAAAYENLQTDQWNEQAGDVKIYYCSPALLTWKNIRVQLESLNPDFIYLTACSQNILPFIPY